MPDLLDRAVERLQPEQIWANPDGCLKARRGEEVRPALINMVTAVRKLRALSESSRKRLFAQSAMSTRDLRHGEPRRRENDLDPLLAGLSSQRSQGIQDHGDVDRLLQQRAVQGRQEAERGGDHGEDRQA